MTPPNADRLRLAVPQYLQDLPAWLVWRAREKPNRPGKFDKVPYYLHGGIRNGTQGSKQDRASLGSFDAALASLEQGQWDGIGLAMLPDWGLVGGDFDHCTIDGSIAPEVQGFVAGTYAEKSPSGNGIRAFWLGTAPDKKNHAEGVETFHGKGFLTVTGDTLNPGADVAPIPEEIKRRLLAKVYASGDPKDNVQEPAHGAKGSAALPRQLSADDIARIRSALGALPSHDRDLWLHMGQAIHNDVGEAGYGLWVEWSATDLEKYNPKDGRRVWESFTQRDDGLTLGTLFHRAKEHGWDGTSRHSEAAILKHPQKHYRLLTDSDLAALPPLQWRIKGVLPIEGLAAWYGASGSGKSFLVLDALQAVAAGADWFGHRVTICPVVYCALEGEGGIAGRVSAYRIRHGSTAEHIRYLVQPFSLLDGGDIHDLAQAIKADGKGAGVVVLDTLNRAAPGSDENDSKAMGQIIAAAKQLQNLIGGLVLLVHHTGKDASKGLRGHSSLHAALDAAIEVRRDGDRREWLIAKSKDGADGAAHPFRLDVVELGTDEDNEPVTSCVIKQVEEMADSIRRALPPKSGNLKIAWDAIGEALRKAGDSQPEGAPESLPHGRPCLTVEAALMVIGSRLAVEPKRRTERARLALTGLCSKGMVTLQDGFLWIP